MHFENPHYQTCYDYWRRLKGDRKSPSWREWDWIELPPNLIPYFLVVDVQFDPMEFQYRFYGTASVTVHGRDYTGRKVNDLRTTGEIETTIAQYSDVVAQHDAIASEYEILAGTTGLPIIQMSLRMPFSEDGERVTQIATFVDWTHDLKRIRSELVGEFGPGI